MVAQCRFQSLMSWASWTAKRALLRRVRAPAYRFGPTIARHSCRHPRPQRLTGRLRLQRLQQQWARASSNPFRKPQSSRSGSLSRVHHSWLRPSLRIAASVLTSDAQLHSVGGTIVALHPGHRLPSAVAIGRGGLGDCSSDTIHPADARMKGRRASLVRSQVFGDQPIPPPGVHHD